MVRLGDVNLNPVVEDDATTVDVPIEDIIVHPNYFTNPIINDIALLLLSNTVQFTSTFVNCFIL